MVVKLIRILRISVLSVFFHSRLRIKFLKSKKIDGLSDQLFWGNII